MNCVFCRIVEGNLPKRLIYEDEHTMAFLDISGDVDGHTLVIPKKHVENIFDSDTDTLTRVISTVKRISDHYVNNCGYSGVNLLNANGPDAQQSVPHFHVHIIPRKKDDSIDAWPTFGSSSKTPDEMQGILAIKEATD